MEKQTNNQGQDDKLLAVINQLSDEIEKHTICIRRKIHMHPEISFKEFETSKVVCSELERIGIPYEKSQVAPGIIATIDSGKQGKFVMLRADMDALPIQENTGLEYASKVPNVMHACGHDVHTSNLLAVGEILTKTRDLWSGKVKLVFQPGEENGGGGREMIKHGLMDDVPDACFGMHVDVKTPGVFTIGEGYVTAYSDGVFITIHGKAAHSSKPQLGVDALNIAAAVVLALNTMTGRYLSPMSSSTFNIGIVKGGTAVNVIADNVEIGCMCRNQTKEDREVMLDKIQKITKGIVESMGGTVDIRIRVGYSAVYNNLDLTKFAVQTISANKNKLYEEIYAPEQIPQDFMTTGNCFNLAAEDFGFYSQKAPSCFMKIGVGLGSPNHNPNFKVDEKYIKIFTRTMALLAIKYLNKK